MRGKNARELRKLAGFKPKSKRSYETMHIGKKEGTKIQFGPDPLNPEKIKVDRVKTSVNIEVMECVDGSRKAYQFYKRKYNDPEYLKSFNVLPSDEFIEEATEAAIKHEEDLKNNSTLSTEPSVEDNNE